MPVLVTYSLVQRLTHALLYKPLANAPLIASVYAALEAGDAVPFYRASLALLDGGSQGSTKPDLLCPVGATPPTEPLETGMEMDAFPAIMCSDGERVDSTPEEVEEYLNKIVGLSKWTGGANMEFLLPCVGRSARPDWRFVPEGITASHRALAAPPSGVLDANPWIAHLNQPVPRSRRRRPSYSSTTCWTM